MPNADNPSAVSPGRRVLLVDDDPHHCELLIEVLKNAGHDVRAVGDPEAALLEIESFQPELAIIDIGLPRMDGYELARRIRDRASCKLIALSGFAADSARSDTAVSSFDHHLVKPLDYRALLLALE